METLEIRKTGTLLTILLSILFLGPFVKAQERSQSNLQVGPKYVFEGNVQAVTDIPTPALETKPVQNCGNEQVVVTSQIRGSAASFEILRSPEAFDYLWDFGDGGISTHRNPKHIFKGEDTYLVTLHVHTACGNLIYQQLINALPGYDPGKYKMD